MSDRMVQLQNNDGEKTSVHPSQSNWFAHRMIPACDSANLLCSNLQEVLREISSCAKRSRQEGEARTYNMAEDSSLGSRKIDLEERLYFQPFPMFSLSKKRKSSFTQNNDQATSGHIRALTSRFHYKSEHLKSILAGEASSESEKELKRSQLLLSQTAIASTKTGERAMKTVLPGKNNKFHHLLTSISKENHTKIQSTTQSLDVCFHADLNHTKSMACTYDSFEQLLSSKWIGHFNINSSKFANCTPKSKKGEATSNETTDEFISKIMSTTSSEPTGEHHRYVLMAFNQTAKTFEKKVSFSRMERQIQETAFSDPWISRWRVSRDAFLPKKPKKKPKATSVCVPQCSKQPLDQTQIEQFSRIASMAMMGKTMTQKYSSLKRGSTQVWNMEGF